MHLLPESLALVLAWALCALLLGLGLHRGLRIALRNLMQGVRRDSQLIRRPVAGSAARRVTHPCGRLFARNHPNVGPGLIGFALAKALRRASLGGTRFAARLDRAAKAAGLAALGLGLLAVALAAGLWLAAWMGPAGWRAAVGPAADPADGNDGGPPGRGVSPRPC